MMQLKFVSNILFVFLIGSGCSNEPDKDTEHLDMLVPKTYFSELMAQREEADRYFKSSESPIPDSARDSFEGIEWFDIDTTFRVAAIFERFANGEIFTIQATGNIADRYQKMGKLHFMISGVECELEVYQNVDLKDAGHAFYFIPFYDLTSAHETYGGGRYLDIPVIAGNKTILDFNYAYQPYCVYNYAYSCPIPPPENRLNVAIRAGEKLGKQMMVEK